MVYRSQHGEYVKYTEAGNLCAPEDPGSTSGSEALQLQGTRGYII